MNLSGGETASGSMVYVAPDAAKAFARRLLIANGLSDEDAEVVADCLVRTELRGVDTHGLMRLPG